MNRAMAQDIRDKLNKMLPGFFDEFDVKIGNITYDQSGWCKVPITFSQEVDGKVMTKEYTDLLEVADQCKINPKQKYEHPRFGTVTLVGYRSRATKYPFVMETLLGKKYGVTMSDAQRYFG